MVKQRIQEMMQSPAFRQWIVWWLFWAILTALYLFWPIQTDFYTDEAYFSEMTLRFIQGQLPNYDFASNYLGLFYVYNSLWFLLFGVSYFALRMGMLFLVSGLFLPTVFFIARRLFSLPWSTLSTLVVLALTVSLNYSVSGNWYALFFSALSVLLFLSPSFKGKQYLIGLVLGITFLMKHTIALFTGSALYLAMVWQWVEHSEISDDSMPEAQKSLFNVLVKLSLFVFPVLVLIFVNGHLDLPRLIFYILPIGLVSLHLFRQINSAQLQNTVGLFKTIGVWIASALIPVLLFCIPYALRQDGISTLFSAVFINYPKIYLNKAFLDYFSMIASESWSVSIWLVVGLMLLSRKPKAGMFLLGVGFLLACLSGDIRQWSNITVSLYFQLPLWGIILGLFTFLRQPENEPLEQSQTESKQNIRTIWLWGLLLFIGTFPLGMMFYAGYAMAPFALLLSYWAYSRQDKLSRYAGIGILTYICIFGALFAYRQIGWHIEPGVSVFPNQTFTKYLGWDRARIWVPDSKDLTTYSGRTQAYYELVKKYSTRADDWFMYSDGPEVYFLTHHQNPTRYSYAIDSTLSDGRDVIESLEKHKVQFVLAEQGQNHFNQPLLANYLNQNFQLKDRIGQNILLFQRVK